jgi:DNA-binding PadR family transcriptional regulator
MIYPNLKILLEGGYIACDIDSTGSRDRKVCSLTPKGEAAYAVAARAWARMLPWLRQCVSSAGVVEPEPAPMNFENEGLTSQPANRIWT